MIQGPQRIVCLSAEAADWFWRIGAWDRVAGVTAFFEQPQPAAAQKPRVSGFSTANCDAIGRLNPDLIVTFSDVQAALAAAFIKQGVLVVATNQRTLLEVEETLMLLARIVNRADQGRVVLEEFRKRLAPVDKGPRRQRVYFEEWNDPLVSGINWVSELIERAGGTDVFRELRTKRAASERVISPTQLFQADPEIIFVSWCGKPMETDEIAGRPGWEKVTAVRNKAIHEIPSDEILQPGFRLVHGYERIKAFLN